ncbi:endopeptidase La [Mycoplasma sp. Ms02]|uniref:endopeptidase La n=1 Tax=Mycoplasma sp. Ms02 TaxID=353851 RepID=UPI001C8AA11B|nr:endopeptidase La [Mycoplasma sp. Ms02]
MIYKALWTEIDRVAFPGNIGVMEVPSTEVNFLKKLMEKDNAKLALIIEGNGNNSDYYQENGFLDLAAIIKPIKLEEPEPGKFVLFYKTKSKGKINKFLDYKEFEAKKEQNTELYAAIIEYNLEKTWQQNFAFEFPDYPFVEISEKKVDILSQAFAGHPEFDGVLSHVTKNIEEFNRILLIFKQTDSSYNLFANIPYSNDIITSNWVEQLYFEVDNKSLSQYAPEVRLLAMFGFFIDSELSFDKTALFTAENATKIVEVFAKWATSAAAHMRLENEITGEISEKLQSQQNEYYLREKMKVIKDRLNETDEAEDEFQKTLSDKKLNKIYPESVKKMIANEQARAENMMPSSPEANIAKTFVDNLKKLPWRKTRIDVLDIKKTREVLDKYHYGLEEVKERIIEYLGVLIKKKSVDKNSKKNYLKIDKDYQIDLSLFKENDKIPTEIEYNNVPILTLVGPPGTGKTSLSKAIAEALNKEFVKISLGGVHDESEIRGHRRTYVGAMPGKIVKAIMKAEVSNPLILLDEIDKMASNQKGDPASAMLEVLDPEQNTKFQDHYLEHEYDLSKALFIATANYYEEIPEALLDRVEIINLSAYTATEKVKIARNYLIPKTIKQASLTPEQFQISDEVLLYTIKHYTLEAGVRGLKRALDALARKVVVKTLEDETIQEFVLDKETVTQMLGTIKFKEETPEVDIEPGSVTGLAYTSAGGSTLQIEVTTYPGKGELKLTGQLKDVMQESAQIALTYVRAHAQEFGIEDFDFENTNIHIHVPEGAVPKDGPSAGVTFTTAIISALSQRAVPAIYGMTGEITLRGKVLEIGGLKEKSFAAREKKLKYVFIPENNTKNLRDVHPEIKKDLIYVPVSKYQQIYDVIFLNKKPHQEITFTEEEDNNK